MEREIQIIKRPAQSKGEIKRLRREGRIPVVIYSRENTPETASLSSTDFEEVLREIQPGFLPTTIFVLKDQNGKKHRAIVKDIQYEVTSYVVIHLDFQELVESEKVDIKVPVECINQVDCVGVKAGGFVRSLMRHVKVRCLPKDIPSHFQVDVKEMELGQFKRISDLAIPTAIRPLSRESDIVVTIVKR